MTKMIRIGDVAIPLESYAIGGTAVLGIRESGKTVLAKGIVEQLLDHGIPPVIYDAIGLWRHLKRAGDGARGCGFKVVVAGGVEPDLPLTPDNAQEIVRAAIRENIPLVIDLYDKKLSKADWRKIVRTTFRTLLYENEGVRHIILEEAAEYAPQKVIDGDVYAEVEKMVRMGGNASLGITLINQRAQEVNKAILDLCENMVLMRQRGAHAIDSLEKWMDRMAPDQSRAVAKELPMMKSGDCWVFTGDNDQVKRTRSEMCRSFHPDRRKPEAKKAARFAADTTDFVSRLQVDLAKVVEEAKANDPKALRANIQKLCQRIAELEHELKKPPAVENREVQAAVQRGFERGRADGYAVGAVDMFGKFAKHVDAVAERYHAARDAVSALYEPVTLMQGLAPPTVDPRAQGGPIQAGNYVVGDATPELHTPKLRATPGIPPGTYRRVSGEAVSHVIRESARSGDGAPVEQRVLDALAELGQMGAADPDRGLVAFMANYKHVRSAGFVKAVGTLLADGAIETTGAGGLRLTSSGASRARAAPRPKTTAELQARIVAMLGGATAKVLQPLIDSYPESISRERLAAAAGYQHIRSAGFVEAISRLTALGFIESNGRGALVARPVLFLS